MFWLRDTQLVVLEDKETAITRLIHMFSHTQFDLKFIMQPSDIVNPSGILAGFYLSE